MNLKGKLDWKLQDSSNNKVLLFCCILPVLLLSEYDEQLVVMTSISIVVSFVVFISWVFILLIKKKVFLKQSESDRPFIGKKRKIDS